MSLESVTGATGYLVKVTSLDDGTFAAEPPGMPELRSQGPTRDDALEEVRRRLSDGLADGELAIVTAIALGPGFGHAKDDPGFDAYLDEIRRYRAERDHADSTAADEST
jgi:hypothetical protein